MRNNSNEHRGGNAALTYWSHTISFEPPDALLPLCLNGFQPAEKNNKIFNAELY